MASGASKYSPGFQKFLDDGKKRVLSSESGLDFGNYPDKEPIMMDNLDFYLDKNPDGTNKVYENVPQPNKGFTADEMEALKLQVDEFRRQQNAERFPDTGGVTAGLSDKELFGIMRGAPVVERFVNPTERRRDEQIEARRLAKEEAAKAEAAAPAAPAAPTSKDVASTGQRGVVDITARQREAMQKPLPDVQKSTRPFGKGQSTSLYSPNSWKKPVREAKRMGLMGAANQMFVRGATSADAKAPGVANDAMKNEIAQQEAETAALNAMARSKIMQAYRSNPNQFQTNIPDLKDRGRRTL